MALKTEFLATETGVATANAYHKICLITIQNMTCVIELNIYFDQQARLEFRQPISRIRLTPRELSHLESQIGDNLVAKAYALIKNSEISYRTAEFV